MAKKKESNSLVSPAKGTVYRSKSDGKLYKSLGKGQSQGLNRGKISFKAPKSAGTVKTKKNGKKKIKRIKY